MFEFRLRILLILLLAGWMILVFRLVQLQIVEADRYRQQADALLIRSQTFMEPVRGRILDRNGRELASDEPCWSISVAYGLLTSDESYLRKLARSIRKFPEFQGQDPPPIDRLVEQLSEQARSLRPELAAFAHRTPTEFEQDVQKILDRVQRIKRSVERVHRREVTIQEEIEVHPLITNLDQNRQIQARQLLMSRFPWLYRTGAVDVVDSSRRVYHAGPAMAHVMGRVAPVQAQDVEKRPFFADGEIVDWGGYTDDDVIGSAGVEWSSERMLRGSRGRVVTFYDDRPAERREAVQGGDVALTIDSDLQNEIYELLGREVGVHSTIPGGAVVVVDIATREVLAMVSYPSYDPSRWNEQYESLSDDTLHRPLWFRAAAHACAPGSIMKPLTIVAAQSSGMIDESYTYECRGSLFPENPKEWRCWSAAGSREPMHHGVLNCEEALKHSCNVFCFHLGDRLGVAELCNWFDMVGIGRTTGIGLREEQVGILPTPSWLETHRGRPASRGDGRNYAIGQGEVELTPIQAVNLVATYASGVYQPLTLVRRTDSTPGGTSEVSFDTTPSWTLPVSPSVWGIIRRGMYDVVNEEGGTARKYAHLDHPEYVLCGKSGSAEVSRWVTQYRIDLEVEGQKLSRTVPADSLRMAKDKFRAKYPEYKDIPFTAHPAAYWPAHEKREGERLDSHAWFVAFLQKKNSSGSPIWTIPPRVAIAVELDFGESGGRNSGPLCRDVARLILDRFPQYVR